MFPGPEFAMNFKTCILKLGFIPVMLVFNCMILRLLKCKYPYSKGYIYRKRKGTIFCMF